MENSTALLRLVLYASWFGLGVAGYMAFTNVMALFRTRGSERRLNLAYLAARLGLIITLGLVTLRVIAPAQFLPVNADTVAYAIGILMVGAGYVGIAIETKRADRRRFK